MTDRSISEGMTPPDATTVRILGRLLDASLPGRDEPAEQAKVVLVRPADADGCLLLATPSAPRADVVRTVPVEAEAEDLDGVTYHVLLFVDDGYMQELEMWREDLGPLLAPVDPEALRVWSPDDIDAR